MINVTLPDESVRSFEEALSVGAIARSIAPSLGKAAIAGRFDGQLVDLNHVVATDGQLAIITAKDDDGVEVIRHSTAHLLAHAVKELFPSAQVTIGPVIDDGFYYDFSFERAFTPEDLLAIEKKMKQLAKKDLKIERSVRERDDASNYFLSLGEAYKSEIIRDLPESEELSLYSQGDFTDLCRGPHVPSTGKLKTFKLLKVAGAYWRGGF